MFTVEVRLALEYCEKGILHDVPLACAHTQHTHTHARTYTQVRLVLEYCDKGSLREALDAGAFLTPQGLNYRGVLDTAADVAKV